MGAECSELLEEVILNSVHHYLANKVSKTCRFFSFDENQYLLFFTKQRRLWYLIGLVNGNEPTTTTAEVVIFSRWGI